MNILFMGTCECIVLHIQRYCVCILKVIDIKLGDLFWAAHMGPITTWVFTQKCLGQSLRDIERHFKSRRFKCERDQTCVCSYGNKGVPFVNGEKELNCSNNIKESGTRLTFPSRDSGRRTQAQYDTLTLPSETLRRAPPTKLSGLLTLHTVR